jgi:Ca2+-binding EF-hand superfamily protein
LWTSLALALFAGAAGRAHSAAPPRSDDRPEDAVQDVLFLGEGRPALLRLRLYADGKSYTGRWKSYLSALFTFLDRDGDGTLSKEEAARAPSVQLLQQLFQGNPYIFNAGVAIPFNQLDADGDGKVSREEFVNYYRNTTAGPIQMSPYYGGAFGGGADQTTEALFKALDTNGDGKLSKAELLAAEKVLSKYDDNDDELVSAQEITAGNPASNVRRVAAQPRRMRRPIFGRPVTTGPRLVLIPASGKRIRATSKLTVARDILRQYDRDGNGKLSRSEVKFPKDLFNRLDTNKDGQLDILELLRWLTGPPDAEIVLRFGRLRDSIERLELLPVRKRGDRVKPGVFRASQNVLGLTTDNARIRVIQGGRNTMYANYRNYIVSQFRLLDREKRNEVTSKQLQNPAYAYLRTILNLADRNGDGKLTRKELDAYLNLVEKGTGCQMAVGFAETGRGLFQLLDTNGDGQLSIRELRNAWKTLASLDVSGTGSITRTQIPRQFQLTVGQGTAVYYPQFNPGYNRGMSPRSRRGPLWFRKMDRNGDGDVSRREFLGSSADFKKIDTDGDGLISVEEAERADAWYRARSRASRSK